MEHKSLSDAFKAFLKDESGQTTTEYILILAVIATIFMQFRKKLNMILKRLMGELDEGTTGITSQENEW